MVGCQGVSAGSHTVQTQPGVLSLASTSLDFGNVTVGTSKALTVTATNTGSASVTVSSATISTKFFTLSAPNLPVTVDAGQSTTIRVLFTPNTAGSFTATATVTSDASGGPTSISLTGTGVADGQVTLSPNNESFGNLTVGAQHAQTVILTNSGNTSITVSKAVISGTAFQLTGISTPLTLAASKSTTFTVTFAPQAPGFVSGDVTITSDATNPTLTMPVGGTGIAAGALGANPTSLSFGNVQAGNNKTLPQVLTNTGGSNVTISQATASGTGFSLSGISTPLTLTPGQSASFNVTFAPQSSGNFSGSVAITSDASNPNLSVALSGSSSTAATLTGSPASMTFASVQVGQNQSQTGTIKNTGGTSARISSVTPSGTGFSVSGINTPVTLAAGQSTSFSVTFTPPSAGTFSGSLAIVSDASNPNLSVGLSGTGTSQTPGSLSVSPTTVSVGNVVVGTSGTKAGSLTAAGAAVTVSSVTKGGTNPSEFSISGLSFPVTIPAGQSATFTVTFTPGATGAASATASFASDASNAPTIANLTGTGTPAIVHTVLLNWNASTTSGIISYNVYRASAPSTNSCGSFGSPISSTAAVVTTFTDPAVTNGSNYCYATTAVDSNGESGLSNVVHVPIP